MDNVTCYFTTSHLVTVRPCQCHGLLLSKLVCADTTCCVHKYSNSYTIMRYLLYKMHCELCNMHLEMQVTFKYFWVWVTFLKRQWINNYRNERFTVVCDESEHQTVIIPPPTHVCFKHKRRNLIFVNSVSHPVWVTCKMQECK